MHEGGEKYDELLSLLKSEYSHNTFWCAAMNASLIPL